ncbi:MAG: transcriptional regulator [Chlorobium sp.]
MIGAFFREIDRADELGSGMPNRMKYGKAYGGADPQLIDGDVFCMIISVPEFGEKQEATAKVAQVWAHDGVHDIRLTETMKKIIILLIEPKSTPQLLAQLGYPRRTRNFEAAIKGLLDFKLIEMTLPDKPRSKNQQYRLTEKGMHLINGIA